MLTNQAWPVRIARAARAAWRAARDDYKAPAAQLTIDGSPFLFRRRFSIVSPLTPTDAAARLRELMEPERAWRLIRSGRPFEGVVSLSMAALRRTSSMCASKNNFSPSTAILSCLRNFSDTKDAIHRLSPLLSWAPW